MVQQHHPRGFAPTHYFFASSLCFLIISRAPDIAWASSGKAAATSASSLSLNS
jgi:hypothetical protein